MSLRLEGNGFSYTVPDTLDVREVVQATEWNAGTVLGRRGGVVSSPVAAPGTLELVLSGYLSEASPSLLRDAFDQFVETLSSGELTATDLVFGRVARVRLSRFAYRRIGGVGGSALRVEVRLLVLEGAWSAPAPTRLSTTLTPLSGNPVVRNLVVDYEGTVSVAPTLRVTLGVGAVWTPAVLWKGSNLVANPSFELGLTNWTVTSGSPTPLLGEGRSGSGTVRLVAGDLLAQTIPVNGGSTHVVSGYVRTPSSGTANLTVEFRDGSGNVVNSFSTTPVVAASWTRVGTVCQGVQTTAAEARVLLGVVSGTVDYDDIQFEQRASASPFFGGTPLALTRNGDLSYATGHRVWTVEMGRGLVRLRDSTGTENDDLAATNGGFFELAAGNEGRQHLTFAAPVGGTLFVELLYTARFL